MRDNPQKKIEMLQRINKYKNEALIDHHIQGYFGKHIDDDDFKQIFKYM